MRLEWPEVSSDVEMIDLDSGRQNEWLLNYGGFVREGLFCNGEQIIGKTKHILVSYALFDNTIV